MLSTYRCTLRLPLLMTKGVQLSKERATPHHNSWLRACVACNIESRIYTLPWPSPDKPSMIVLTQLEAGFVAKHYVCSNLIEPSTTVIWLDSVQMLTTTIMTPKCATVHPFLLASCNGHMSSDSPICPTCRFQSS
ncbi:hypothetical protein TNCV_2005481 [Trichonephila clavipes]|nr:hypothetical protein TNCV_2005481 [Trichonephila clavipes]